MSSQAILEAPPVATAPARVESQPVTLRRVVGSEWIKFRTLRSSWAVLGTAVVGMLITGLVVAYNTRHLTSNLQANDLAPSATLQGYYIGQFLLGALGVLFVSGEYGTGMIRSTLTAVPKRLPVLWAKLLVFLTVAGISMVAVSFVTFMSSQALLSHFRPGTPLGAPGALRVVLGTAAYLTLIGVVGSALGWIVRNTAGALIAFFALVILLPVIFVDVIGHWGRQIGQLLPSQAGASLAQSIAFDKPSLSPAIGLVVLLAWAIAGLVAAAWILRRRDA